MVDKTNYEDIIETIDEVINEDYAKQILKERPLNIYWGTTPSAIPNLNYLLPLMQICNFLKNNCNVKILLVSVVSTCVLYKILLI